MAWSRLTAGLLLMLLQACAPEPDAQARVPAARDELSAPPQLRPSVELSAEAIALRKEIMAHARAGSLRRLARLAGEQQGFISNLGGQRDFEFWDLLRRTGVDPARLLLELLDGPPGERVVNDETWFVWPDLAARDPRDLVPGKLTFQERRRLHELIGEDGIRRLAEGQGYPGMRTAISADGRWIYFVLGTDEEREK